MLYLIKFMLLLLISVSFLGASTSASNNAKEMAINNSTTIKSTSQKETSKKEDNKKESNKKEVTKVQKKETDKKSKKVVSKAIQAKEIKQTVDLNISDTPIFYPQPSSEPLEVTKEAYEKSGLALAGLTGVYVNIDDVLKGASSKEVKLLHNLKEEVVKRLNKAGIRLLTEEEMEKTPGQPQMSMFPSFPKHLSKPTKGQPAIVYRANCCTMGIWTSFLEGGTMLRNPKVNYKLGTWGQGHNTNDCSDIGGWMSDVVLQTIDKFTEDKVKADTDYKEWLLTHKVVNKKAVSEKAKEVKKVQEVKTVEEAEKAEEVEPVKDVKKAVVKETVVTEKMTKLSDETCSTSLTMYIEMFKTDSSFIIPSKRYVLKKLVNVMKSCPDYSYIIETHADARASREYNRKLTEKRAKAIRFYLLSQGVSDAQFDIQPFGENEPVAHGESPEDHVANRRVVVTPFRIK